MGQIAGWHAGLAAVRVRTLHLKLKIYFKMCFWHHPNRQSQAHEWHWYTCTCCTLRVLPDVPFRPSGTGDCTATCDIMFRPLCTINLPHARPLRRLVALHPNFIRLLKDTI